MLAFVLVACGLLASASDAHAGGYDTPMLYSARHMGMGGTAVSYVDDASALFHNPAGLGNVDLANLHLDVSLAAGRITGSPSADAISAQSELTIAPFFLAGGAVRLHDYLVLGLAAYPVASAGGTYEYSSGASAMEDSTRLLFYEVAPAVAVSIPEARLNLGASYRVTVARLDREVFRDGDYQTRLALRGTNFAGFRVGAQWEAVEDHLRVGLHYRHKTETDVEEVEDPVIFGAPLPGAAASTTFVLPSRFSFGVDGGTGPYRIAFDLEYALNSQNESSTFDVGGIPIANVAEWQNAVTARVGGEYTIAGRFPVRVGYVFDGKTANEAFPTAFGTPPAPTHVVTAGAGYESGPWRAAVALAHRFGEATVDASDLGQGCSFCGREGTYAIRLTGLYVDVSYDFARPIEVPAEEPPGVEEWTEPAYEEEPTDSLAVPVEPAPSDAAETGIERVPPAGALGSPEPGVPDAGDLS